MSCGLGEYAEPRLKSAKEAKEKIYKYFQECEEKGKPLTVTGLALALGFRSRQSLLNYQKKEKFGEIITEAKLRIEEYVESRLYDRDGCNGAKFTLAAAYGWVAKSEQVITAPKDNPVVVLAEVKDIN